MSEVKLEDIVSLAKRRGFIYQGSEVYGGLSGTWDYGPLGVTLKRNIMNLWWQTFVESRDDIYGVDAAILMNPNVWKASGHAATFTDPIVFCDNCHNRFRVDKIVDEDMYKDQVETTLREFLQEQWKSYKGQKALVDELKESTSVHSKNVQEDLNELNKLREANISTSVYQDWSDQLSKKIEEEIENKKKISKKYDYLLAFLRFMDVIDEEIEEAKKYTGRSAQEFLNFNVNCPSCNAHGQWTVPRQFNMMLRTHVGPLEDDNSLTYLRPETAQGIFTNYKNILDNFYPDLPFGIAQQGKAFRNEISPRDFVFRSREFEQMEIEYFVHPEHWKEVFEQWIKDIKKFLNVIGLPESSYEAIEVDKDDRAHYSERTIDFEFNFPHKRDELLGLAYRASFDLVNIHRESGKNMEYTIKGTQDKFIPHVIEPSFGVERMIMAVLTSAYRTDEQNGEKRIYLALPENLAPVKYAVSPLLKNKPELVAKAREVYDALKKKHGNVMWDDNGNIGKRYRRQDEIGTPYCVVIDFDTLEDDTVTIRDRDTTEQKRVKISEII